MTRDEVRASAARVVRWHRRFAPRFGRRESQEHSLDYLKGLFFDQPRKSVELIALQFARSSNDEPATRKEVRFRTKPQIAAEMILRTQAAGKVRFDWIIADELYGDSGPLLDALEDMHQRYLLEVKKNTLAWTVDPSTLPGYSPGPKRRKKLGSYRYKEVRSVQEIVAELPAGTIT
ncbi:MAG: transposase [Rhodopirellula sp.]|nr:transposase [Rhodopirellula sp.]